MLFSDPSLPLPIPSPPSSHYLQCVQNLVISQDHLSLVRGFPADFRFIILQHSPNRYCCVYSLFVSARNNTLFSMSMYVEK